MSDLTEHLTSYWTPEEGQLFPEQPKTIDEAMEAMPEHYRTRWCTASECGCAGCANGPGNLLRYKFTFEDWADWMARHGLEMPQEAIEYQQRID